MPFTQRGDTRRVFTRQQKKNRANDDRQIAGRFHFRLHLMPTQTRSKRKLPPIGAVPVQLSSSRMSASKCRQLLGPSCQLTDAEIELLRDQLYGFAHVVIEAWHEWGKADAKKSAAARRAEINEAVTERAAIMEFDGRVGRREAERRARSDIGRFGNSGKDASLPGAFGD